jgi:hypothetical protein
MLDDRSDYMKFRGKCKEMSEALVASDPSLRLVRGHYYEPAWERSEQHWWCQRKDGTVVDPTKDQFPSKGNSTYTEFSGFLSCTVCDKEITEEEIDCHSSGRHIYCSYECFGSDVM